VRSPVYGAAVLAAAFCKGRPSRDLCDLPRDVIGNVVHVMRIATDEEPEGSTAPTPADHQRIFWRLIARRAT
jgi:hypothetical protein